jgi:predicted RNA-binding Zn-ribbon protein involved in translation (DUF1610 family)
MPPNVSKATEAKPEAPKFPCPNCGTALTKSKEGGAWCSQCKSGKDAPAEFYTEPKKT